MASVRFRCPDGSIRRHEAPRGATVLSCQIEVNDDVDGIVVEIAPVQ